MGEVRPLRDFINVGETITIICSSNSSLQGQRNPSVTMYCRDNGMYSRTVFGNSESLPVCSDSKQSHNVYYSSQVPLFLRNANEDNMSKIWYKCSLFVQMGSFTQMILLNLNKKAKRRKNLINSENCINWYISHLE